MKNLLILGASSDIAWELAKLFAAEKWNITLAGRNIEELNRSARDINIRYGCQSTAVKFDVLEYTFHELFYFSLPMKPDLVVCAIGFLGDQKNAENDWTLASNIIDTNFKGVVSILSVIANDFEKKEGGTIIAISSVAGDRGRASNYFYGSAKAGLTAFLSGLAQKLHKSNTHVMIVKPGFVNTRMTKGLDLPKILVAEPIRIAQQIKKGFERRKFVLYTPIYWRLIIKLIKEIPSSIFVRLPL